MSLTFIYRIVFIATIGLFVLLHAPIGAAANTAPHGLTRFVEQIYIGESLYRDDVVEDAVQRLYRLYPDHPEGLAAELRLAVRRGDLKTARQLLKSIQAVAAGSALSRASETLIRLEAPTHAEMLTKARLYSAAGRVQEARRLYDEVLRGVFPTVDLALEYWRLRSREPSGKALSAMELEALLSRYPRHAGLLAALADYRFSEGRPEQALQYLHRLSQQPVHREGAANREYEYLSSLPTGSESLAAWTSFVQRYVDLAVAARAQKQVDQQTALMADPSWRGGREGLQLVEGGKSKEALPLLQRAVKAYPDDADLQGALGIAYLRTGSRSKALPYFVTARDKEVLVDKASKWVSLIQSTRYWLLLEQAGQALERKAWNKASELYSAAHQLDQDDIYALIGLGDADLGRKRLASAWNHYRRAFVLAPRDEATHRGMARFFATGTPQQAISTIDTLPLHHQVQLAPLRRSYQLAMLLELAATAQAQHRWADAVSALSKAQQLDLDDPWLSYRLATALRETGRDRDAMSAYELHLYIHGTEPASRYAHALLLESSDQWQAAIDSLRHIDRERWTTEMAELEQRLQIRQRIARATALRDAGQSAQAIAELEAAPRTATTRLQVADWSLSDGNFAKALSNYRTVLREDPTDLDARLGELETYLAQGRVEAVRHALQHEEPSPALGEINSRRRLALLWHSVGASERARTILAETVVHATAPSPILYRDWARMLASEQPQDALDQYERAMQDDGMLPPRPEEAVRDNVSFTRAMRLKMTDDWLQRSIRSDAEALYQRQNPTLNLSNDTWGRQDGTPGLSRLNANTTIMQLDFPVYNGKTFIRADHVRMDAGTFETEDGQHETRFGTCAFGGEDAKGDRKALPGCSSGLQQKASGTGFAVGWRGERLAFDIGRTPQGFPISNWVGGISYQGDLATTGWTLTASRRPMSSSLLSFAGTTDPRTGMTWGGVMATGVSLGLSWDQGGTDGVWADISHHKLAGKNVADNHRTRLMAGYYRRLINRPDESLTIGMNAMHWRYQKDLGEYTLGHGGYYSPTRYSSVSLPVSYAWRNPDWSFLVEGSVSRSVSHTGGTSYYPVANIISGPLVALKRLGVGNGSFAQDNNIPGSSGGGLGYSVRGVVERRLGNHWVIGGGVDLQHGEDYTPSRLMLYLRYTFEPWQGDLKIKPSALTPYADFK